MFLAAQRVEHKDNRKPADHFYHYQHKGNKFLGLEAPEIGVLINKHTVIPAGGNPVLSFVDVICPEGTTADQIRRAYMQDVAAKGLIETRTMACKTWGYTDIAPGPGIPCRIPWGVTGGNNGVWFNIHIQNISPGVYWFIEAPRLLNLLLDWAQL